MYQDHPNLSPEINAAMRDMELNGGIHYDKLPAGSRVAVKTKNSFYILEKRSAEESFICGNAKYCPIPTFARIHGSTWGGSMIRLGWLGIGMHLEFSIGDGKAGAILTSPIEDVKLLPPE